MADTYSIFTLACVVAVSFTVRDLLLAAENPKAVSKDQSKNMEGHTVLAEPSGPSIKFLICYGWGYKKVFEEYAQVIRQRYPQLSIQGGNYPPGPLNQMIAQVISIIKWIILGTIVFGDKVKVWDMVGMTPPGVYTWSQHNKIVSCLGVFFLSNTIENALIQTGAFEVELNGMPVWSKLKTGRVPQGSELFEIIENQLQLSSLNKDKKISDTFQLPNVPHVERDGSGDDEKNDFLPDEDQQINEKYEDEFSEIDKEAQEEKSEKY